MLNKLTLKWVTFVFAALFWITVHAEETDWMEITTAIEHLAPHLDRKAAMRYGIIIEQYSLEYDIDWRIPVAIFQQESSFILDAVNYKSADFGIGQLSWKWHIKPKQINLSRLLHEPDYAIHQTFKILAKLKGKYDTGSKSWRKWYTRYHSFTVKRRIDYYKKLLVWFRKIDGREAEKKKKDYSKRTRPSKKNVGSWINRTRNYGHPWLGQIFCTSI